MADDNNINHYAHWVPSQDEIDYVWQALVHYAPCVDDGDSCDRNWHPGIVARFQIAIQGRKAKDKGGKEPADTAFRYYIAAKLIGYQELMREIMKAWLKKEFTRDEMQERVNFITQTKTPDVLSKLAQAIGAGYKKLSPFEQITVMRYFEAQKAKEKGALTEASSGLTAEDKMRLWANGRRNVNVSACSDAKLKQYYDICVAKGYSAKAVILEAEARRRHLQLANGPSTYNGPSTSVAARCDAKNILPSDITPEVVRALLSLKTTPESVSFGLYGYVDHLTPQETRLLGLLIALALGEKDFAKGIRDGLVNAWYGLDVQEIKRQLTQLIKQPGISAKLAEVINTVNAENIDESLEEDIEKHDTLNPKLWTEDMKLKPEVAEKINLIVDEFIDGLEKDGIKINVKDVVLIGSNCSYNYTKDSDLDIHIITETKSLKCPDELYPALYSAYRKLFEKKFDIEFYGIPIELYVETEGLPTVSNGCYSVKNGKWIREPVFKDIPDLDQEAFDKEFSEWEGKYDELLKELGEAGERPLEEAVETAEIEKIEDFINELYALRKDGLTADGEYGNGNLIFKEFRNRGYLDNLKRIKNELIAKELSLAGDGEELGPDATEERPSTDAEPIDAAAEDIETKPFEEPFEEDFDGKAMDRYKSKLTKLIGTQAIVQPNGRFDAYNVNENDVQRILTQLRQAPYIAYADKTAGRFDLSGPGFTGRDSTPPRRKYNIHGKIKID